MMLSTCKPCRTKKVKCSGEIPRCNQCQRSKKPVECLYEKASTDDKATRRGLSKRGESCLPCKTKKKKCDLVRPFCSTCRTARKEDLCVYPGPSPYDKADNRTRRIEPAQMELTGPLAIRPAKPSQYEFVQRFSMIYASRAFRRGDIYGIDSRQGDPSYALSDVSIGDMNMNFRFLFLHLRAQHGFRFMFCKQQAIILEDMTNEVVHPFFIHFAHAFGCNLFLERQRDYNLLPILEGHLKHVWHSMESMREEDDPLSFAQACFFLFYASTYNMNRFLGQRFLKLAADCVKRHDIRLVFRNMEKKPALPTEEDTERIGFLCELLCAEVDIVLVSGGDSQMLTGIETQFQEELPEAFPTLLTTSRSVMRLTSVLSAKIGAYLIMTYSPQTMPTAAWFAQCDKYLRKAHVNIVELNNLLRTYEAANENDGRISLEYTGFTYFIPLSEIQKILSEHTLLTRTQELCDETVAEVNDIVKNIPERDLKFITQFIQSCWARAFALFAKQISPTTVSKPAARIFNGDSPFAQASVLLIAQSQSKFKNIDMDTGGKPVCTRLERRAHILMDNGRYATFDDET